MLAAAPRRDMTETTVIYDELQLLGDLTRGQDAEILLTLIKRPEKGCFRESIAPQLADDSAIFFP